MLVNVNKLIKNTNTVESVYTVILNRKQIEEFENQIRYDIFQGTPDDEPIERTIW